MTSYINLKGMPSIETCAWNFVNNLAPIAGCWARTRGNWNANKYYKINLPSQQRNPLCLHVAWTSVWIPPAKKIGISFFSYQICQPSNKRSLSKSGQQTSWACAFCFHLTNYVTSWRECFFALFIIYAYTCRCKRSNFQKEKISAAFVISSANG